MSFQTIRCVQSADVVGKSRILLILYNPNANQARLRARNKSLGVVRLLLVAESVAKCAKDLLTDMMAVKGEIMAEDVIPMEKILS